MAYKDKANAIKYNNEFIKLAYDRINLTIPKGLKAEWTAAAQRAGLSLNAFILEAVEEKRSGGVCGISPGVSLSREESRSPSHDADPGEATLE